MAAETAQQQQVATQQTIPLPTQEQQVAQGHYGYGPGQVPPRAEGYRPAAIRESRIKDRPYKPINDSLSIKIELDLEVEVCWFLLFFWFWRREEGSRERTRRMRANL
jgi:hypothetical protein